MTKSKPTVASLTTEVAELKDSVAQLVALFTEPTEAAPKAKKPTKTAKKPNGNKWFLRLKDSKVWKEMKDQGSTAKNRTVFAEHKENGNGLKFKNHDDIFLLGEGSA